MPTPRKVSAQKTRVAMLCALRDRLARDCDLPGRIDPAVALRLQVVLAEIDELGVETPAAEPVDEVAERRRKRRGSA